jgi:4-amino-4-deoxy-L-arabinose transferase-like glycosyltransferase
VLNEKAESGEHGLAIYAPIAVVLILATIFLRFWSLEYIEFKGDEFKAIELAYKNIFQEGMASTGLMSSIGLHNPPFFVYLISIPVYFSTDPVAVTSFVIVINLIGLIFFYYLAKTLFNSRLAIVMTLLFASSPRVIIYSRKIWAQDCLFPFLMAFYWVLFSNIKKYHRLKVYLMFFLFGCITQLHMSAWFLPVPLLIFFCIYKIKIPLKDSMVGLGIMAGMYAPYLITIFESFDHLLNKETLSWGFPMNLVQAFAITGGGNFEHHIGIEGMRLFAQDNFLFIHNIFFFLFYALATVGLIFGIFNRVKFLRTKQSGHTAGITEQALTLFLLIFICIQLSYFVLRVYPHPHYSIIFYPILTIFTVILIDDLFKRAGLKIKNVISTTLVCLLISNIYFTASVFNFIRDHPEKIEGDYKAPYIYSKEKWREKFTEKGIPFRD